jgi:hypothetical protein
MCKDKLTCARTFRFHQEAGMAGRVCKTGATVTTIIIIIIIITIITTAGQVTAL